MGWDEKRYEEVKAKVAANLKEGKRTPSYYMNKYKEMVEVENYEACKAITELLAPLNYHTADTHSHIPSLNKK